VKPDETQKVHALLANEGQMLRQTWVEMVDGAAVEKYIAGAIVREQEAVPLVCREELDRPRLQRHGGDCAGAQKNNNAEEKIRQRATRGPALASPKKNMTI
jgi:hypothetical protein